MKQLQQIVSCCFFVTALICLPSPIVNAESDTSKNSSIVVSLPLTGKLGAIGTDLRRAIELSDAKDGAVIFEDDSFDPKQTVSVTQRHLASKNGSAFVYFGSGTSIAAKPLVESARVPAISIAMSDKTVSAGGTMFRYYASVRSQADAIRTEIERRGYTSVAFVVSLQEAMIGFQQIFSELPQFKSSTFVEVHPGDTELKSSISRVLKSNPDAICLLLLPPELPVFARQARELGFKGAFFGPTQLGNPDAIKAATGALEGAWLTAIDETPSKAFIERYRATYGIAPTSEAIIAYDSVELLRTALKSAHPIESIRSLEGYNGMFKGLLTLVAPNTIAPPIAIKTVVNNEIVQR